jgi:hypothetical protein
MRTVTWGAMLEDWATFLSELERSLDAGDWEAFDGAAAWEAPEALSGAPTDDEQARALALAARAERLRERLELAMRQTSLELGGERRKANGALAYLAADARR